VEIGKSLEIPQEHVYPGGFSVGFLPTGTKFEDSIYLVAVQVTRVGVHDGLYFWTRGVCKAFESHLH